MLKNILLVNSVYYPDLGGSGIIAKNHAEELLNLNCKVTVFCGGTKNSEETINKVDIIRNKTINEFSPYRKENYFNKKLEDRFLDIIKKSKIDLVHFNSIQGLGANLIDLSLKNNIRTVLTMHDFWWVCPFLFLNNEYLSCEPAFNHHKHCSKIYSQKNLLIRKKYLFNILKNEKLIKTTVSQTMKLALKYLKIPKIDDAIVIENGITKKPLIYKKDEHKSKKIVNFAYFGGENRSKGFDLIFKSSKILKKNKVNFNIYCFGINKPHIKSIINYNLLKKHNIKLRGAYKNQNINKILSDIDVVLIPSRMFESFSLIARESLACGKTIISSGSGALSEIKNSNHLVFYANSSQDLANKMFDVIQIRSEVGADIEEIKYLTLNDHCQQYLKIYSDKS